MITLKINIAKTKNLLKDTDILMYEIKTEDFYKRFSSDKEIVDFSSYSGKSKYFVNSNKLVISEMKHETAGVAIK